MNKFSSNFNTSISNPYQKKEGTFFVPARVKDIILDSSHSEYDKYGGPNSVGVIKYELVGRSVNVETTEDLPGAYPINNTVRTLPLVNEVVLLQVAPDNTLNEIKGNNKTTYYATIVGIWNHPNHNGSPSQNENSLDLGQDIEEAKDVNPMQPFPGDFILDGRQGQSIRFTGFKSNKNPFVDDSNNGKPLLIISNGQEEVGNGYDHIIENVDKDASSIYLTSDHKIKLTSSRNKYNSLNKAPKRANEYKGSQVLINSGRLIFNSKEEDINFTSKNIFSISAKEIGLDGVDYIGLDATKIYLGQQARKLEQQPVILGDALEGWLYTLSLALDRVADALSSAITTDGMAIPTLNIEGPILKSVIQGLNRQIKPGGSSLLKSKKVYTE